jgi:hypothetical protein
MRILTLIVRKRERYLWRRFVANLTNLRHDKGQCFQPVVQAGNPLNSSLFITEMMGVVKCQIFP